MQARLHVGIQTVVVFGHYPGRQATGSILWLPRFCRHVGVGGVFISIPNSEVAKFLAAEILHSLVS
jgi:hypothetical protein